MKRYPASRSSDSRRQPNILRDAIQVFPEAASSEGPKASPRRNRWPRQRPPLLAPSLGFGPLGDLRASRRYHPALSGGTQRRSACRRAVLARARQTGFRRRIKPSVRCLTGGSSCPGRPVAKKPVAVSWLWSSAASRPLPAGSAGGSLRERSPAGDFCELEPNNVCRAQTIVSPNTD
jgi:hypothetical protein